MSVTPSYEYEVLHQFEAIFRDGEHRTQAATRDYRKVWENVIDNPPEEGVTPIVVYRMNGATCAAIVGLDDLVENEECAMEIARLAARVAELEGEVAKLRACVLAADAYFEADANSVLKLDSSYSQEEIDEVNLWLETAEKGRVAYRAARAEVEKP